MILTWQGTAGFNCGSEEKNAQNKPKKMDHIEIEKIKEIDNFDIRISQNHSLNKRTMHKL